MSALPPSSDRLPPRETPAISPEAKTRDASFDRLTSPVITPFCPNPATPSDVSVAYCAALPVKVTWPLPLKAWEAVSEPPAPTVSEPPAPIASLPSLSNVVVTVKDDEPLNVNAPPAPIVSEKIWPALPEMTGAPSLMVTFEP